jgi:esterase/lipase superfamily enzyme
MALIGLGLETTARGAARWMTTLAARYGFRRIVVVAHSMGGFVARAAINEMAENAATATWSPRS